MSTVWIKGGRVIDPASKRDEVTDIFIEDGRIVSFSPPKKNTAIDETIEAKGLVVSPALVDLSARLREPGEEYKATIASESLAAVKGGITTLCYPPDTMPIMDTPAVAEFVQRRASTTGRIRILPIGALTQGLQGTALSEMAALKEAGCIGMGQGDVPMHNLAILRRAFQYAATFDLMVFLQPEEAALFGSGGVHDGVVAARMGLKGVPESAETIGVMQAVLLAAETGVRLHLGRVSSRLTVELLKFAKAQKLPITADVAVTSLMLTENDIAGFNAQAYTRPPLRSEADREALCKALIDGVIDAVCSDHRPHHLEAKLNPFPATSPGVSSLEVLLPLVLSMGKTQGASLPQILSWLTAKPANLLKVPFGVLKVGAAADICIFDPEKIWTLTASDIISQGKNTPFLDWQMQGQVKYTLFEGRVVYPT